MLSTSAAPPMTNYVSRDGQKRPFSRIDVIYASDDVGTEPPCAATGQRLGILSATHVPVTADFHGLKMHTTPQEPVINKRVAIFKTDFDPRRFRLNPTAQIAYAKEALLENPHIQKHINAALEKWQTAKDEYEQDEEPDGNAYLDALGQLMDGLTRALVSAGDIVESRTQTFRNYDAAHSRDIRGKQEIYRRGVAVAEAARQVEDLTHANANANTADAADATRVLGEALAQLHEVDHRGALPPPEAVATRNLSIAPTQRRRTMLAQANRCAERMEHIASTLAAAGTFYDQASGTWSRQPTGRSRLRTSEVQTLARMQERTDGLNSPLAGLVIGQADGRRGMETNVERVATVVQSTQQELSNTTHWHARVMRAVTGADNWDRYRRADEPSACGQCIGCWGEMGNGHATSSRRKAAHWSVDYCSPTASK